MNKDSKYILAIDDNSILLETVRDILMMINVNVYMANSGKMGLTLFSKHHSELDMVIVDMVMPEMSGEETIRRIRQLDKKIPVVLSTGYIPKNVDLKELKVNAYLVKPYTIEDMTDLVNSFLV